MATVMIQVILFLKENRNLWTYSMVYQSIYNCQQRILIVAAVRGMNNFQNSRICCRPLLKLTDYRTIIRNLLYYKI